MSTDGHMKRMAGVVVLIGLTLMVHEPQPTVHVPLPPGRDVSPYPHTNPQSSALLAKLPLAFVENQGQWDKDAKFMARKGGLVARFEPDAITLHLTKRDTEQQTTGVKVRLAFEGASKAVRLEGQTQQAGVYNFFLGNDSAKWRTQVPSYQQVVYRGLYEGVDLQVHEHEGRLEYDALLAPGADLRQVAIRVEGIQRLELAADGSLLMHTTAGAIEQKPPTTWHELPSGERQPVAARFVLLDDHRYSFEVPQRNPQLALVIDPGLSYSTYLGGLLEDIAFGIAVDSAGHPYVTGRTASFNFPMSNPLQANNNGGCTAFACGDVFVTKFDPTGVFLIFSTYLGGGGFDEARGIALDATGNAYVTGYTDSSNFPTTAGAYDTMPDSYTDAFILKLNPVGSVLMYSTFLGGNLAYDEAVSIAVDAATNAYVTGYTVSLSFPVTPGAYAPNAGGAADAFVTKLNPQGSALVYSTYLGGNMEDKGKGIAVDVSGHAYVTGHTLSSNFPTTVGAYDITCGTDGFCNGTFHDAFVTKVNPQGTALVYSTYLGGESIDIAEDIALDLAGNAYVTGQTQSSVFFPTTGGVYMPNYQLFTDAFVTKLNPQGSGLSYSTFLAGMSGNAFTTIGQSIAVDNDGQAYVTGQTNDFFAFPLQNPIQATFGGFVNAFVTKLTPTASGLVYSTYLGGANIDIGRGIAVDASGNAYVTGQTTSSFAFPIQNAFQPVYAGTTDAFVTRINRVAQGVSSYGMSTAPACTGPIELNTNGSPTVGNLNFAVTIANGPPNGIALLVLSSQPDPNPLGTSYFGVTVYLSPTNILTFPVTLDGTGFGVQPFPLPAALVPGATVYVQAFMIDPCLVGVYAASNPIAVTIQ